MESSDNSIENAAAAAAGTLGGSAAIPRLSTFVSSGDAEKRISGANGLGRSRAREAVPILIGLLLDSDSNVRQSAVSGLWLLTHHAVLNVNEWADISTAESAASVHQRWTNWWSSHEASCEIHGMADCSSPEPL
jgi:HEAT repeat protein